MNVAAARTPMLSQFLSLVGFTQVDPMKLVQVFTIV
uniref:Uncharacterized protein n=1 Tax=Nymphaea colorata TaxID=210225 RepID=A0A5K0VUX3_9MAGN